MLSVDPRALAYRLFNPITTLDNVWNDIISYKGAQLLNWHKGFIDCLFVKSSGNLKLIVTISSTRGLHWEVVCFFLPFSKSDMGGGFFFLPWVKGGSEKNREN